MSGNHVEQLESRVRELEATVDGLTDELLDTKDRLETVEEALAEDGERTEGGSQAEIVDGNLQGEEKKEKDRTVDADIAEEAEREREREDTSGTESDVAEAEDGEREGIKGIDEEMDGIIVA